MITLTFDSDHMTERLMEQFLDEYPNLPASVFFVIQRYRCLEKRNHEICPHPLKPDDLSRLQREIKQPKTGVRFHSCWWSHKLMEHLYKKGYTYSSNVFSPTGHIFKLFGVLERPYCWMDNLAFASNDSTCFMVPPTYGLVVFHPIHILLNSNSTRSLAGFRSSGKLIQNKSHGVRDVFDAMLKSSEFISI